MPSIPEPGWYLEPGSDRVERFWDADGPTDELRFRDPRQPDTAPSDPFRIELDLGKHPYRTGGLRWWLQFVPYYGRYSSIPDYQRGRDEAIETGEIKRWPRPWRIAGYALLAAIGALLVIDKVHRMLSP